MRTLTFGRFEGELGKLVAKVSRREFPLNNCQDLFNPLE